MASLLTISWANSNRVPATAVRVQHHLVEQQYPKETAKGTFKRFRNALTFYDQHVNCFAFDIMTLDPHPDPVAKIADAYVASGKYKSVASVYLAPDHSVVLSLHEGKARYDLRPRWGIIDTLTRSHGCFAHYIEVLPFTRQRGYFRQNEWQRRISSRHPRR